MLNSTKTWQEELWDRFKSPLGYSSIDNKNNSMYDLEKFISDLRKKDEVELIEIFKQNISSDGFFNLNQVKFILERYYNK